MIKLFRLKVASLLIISGALMATEGVVIAADEHAATVKYRTTVMDSLGSHIHAIYIILEGAGDYTNHVKLHADALHSMSEIIPSMFPFGSGSGKTRANSAIWEEEEDFALAMRNFESSTANLVEAAKSGNTAKISNSVEEVGAACGGCHRVYRKPK